MVAFALELQVAFEMDVEGVLASFDPADVVEAFDYATSDQVDVESAFDQADVEAFDLEEASGQEESVAFVRALDLDVIVAASTSEASTQVEVDFVEECSCLVVVDSYSDDVQAFLVEEAAAVASEEVPVAFAEEAELVVIPVRANEEIY